MPSEPRAAVDPVHGTKDGSYEVAAISFGSCSMRTISYKFNFLVLAIKFLANAIRGFAWRFYC